MWLDRIGSHISSLNPRRCAAEIQKSRLPWNTYLGKNPSNWQREPFHKMWDAFFPLCCGENNDPKHRELTRDLHGLWWGGGGEGGGGEGGRKELKRRVNGEETQKHSDTPGRTNNVHSADLGLFMSDKHSVFRSLPLCSRRGRRTSTKASKTLVPHGSYIWSVSHELFHVSDPTAVEEMGDFFLLNFLVRIIFSLY